MVWNPFAITALVGAALAWALAIVILRLSRERGVSRRLALLLLLEGVAVLSSGAGLDLLFGSPRTVAVIAQVHFAVDCLLFGLYLPFVARALDTPLLRPFRRRSVELVLLALSVGGAVAVFVEPELFIASVVASPRPRLFTYLAYPGPAWPFVAVALTTVFAVALAGAVSAWRRAGSDVARQRARAFAVAFGLRDAVWALVYLTGAISFFELPLGGVMALLQLYGVSLVVYVLLATYGMLTAHLFDIELRVKWTIQQGTVAAAFVAVYFFVSEGATAVLSEAFGSVLGLLAAALLIFLLVPLQRVGQRVADAAMPRVTGSPEYEAYRKLQIYSAALEGAYREGGVTDRERAMLENLGSTLGIHPADAARLEDEVRPGRAATPEAPLTAPSS